MPGAAEEASLAIVLRARDEAAATIGGVKGALGGIGQVAAGVAIASAAALITIGAASIKMAGDFQQATTRLVTEAGESAANIDMIRAALLRLGPEVGKAPKELADGLYYVESAGFHGQDGLNVLRASAIAARVGLADMVPVADAVTSALNAYGMKSTDATHVTDLLLSTVSEGKLQFEDLAGNIGKVLPIAAAAHVQLGELGAAIATMTAQGTDAAQATTALRFLISNLIGPSTQAKNAMHDIGMSSIELSTVLETKGLRAALLDITDHIGKKFPQGGAAAQAMLKEIVGGTRGMTAALELTGPHMGTFTKNIAGMVDASSGAGETMRGWGEVQKGFNFQMDRAKAAVEAAAIQIGMVLLPHVTRIVQAFSGALPAISRFAVVLYTDLVAAINIVIGAIEIFVGIIQAVGTAINEHRTRYEVLAAFILAVLTPAIIGLAATIVTRLVMSVIQATVAFLANSVSLVAQAVNYTILYTQIGLYTIRLIAGTVATWAHNVATVALTVVQQAFNVVQNEGILGLIRWIVQMTIVRGATIAWTVAQAALNLIMSLNPIGIVILAIAGLIAIMVLLYNKVPAVHAVVNALWSAFQVGAGIVMGVIGPAVKWLADRLGDLFGIIGKVAGALSGLGNIHLPNISLPHFQAGGIAARPTVAMVGETEPEAIIPFSKMAAVLGGLAGHGGGGSQTIVLQVDGREMARVVLRHAESERRLRGGWLGTGA